MVILVALAVVAGGGLALATSGDDEEGQTTTTTAGGQDEQPVTTADEDDERTSASGGSTDDPAEVVEHFLAAAADSDCPAMAELVTDTMREGTARMCDELQGDPEGRAAFADEQVTGPVEMSGDTAMVPVGWDGDTDVTYGLVQENGTWKIDAVG